MESCCVEEFLPSAEAEDIWGFTRAMEMVGGVSLVIVFSLCKGMDAQWSSHETQMAMQSKCFKESTAMQAALFSQHSFMAYVVEYVQTCKYLGSVFGDKFEI